jgi:hypothetical protein
MILLPGRVKRSVRLRAESRLTRICYPHVPKCAGMAVVRSIEAQSFTRLERRLFPIFSVDIRASLRAAEATSSTMMAVREEVLAYALARGRYRFATGHVASRPRMVDEFQRDWNFVTVLRDPVERWISEYVYNTGKASEWARIELPIDEYLRSPTARLSATSFLRYFSHIPEDFDGDPSGYIREATENLSRFAVVGRSEDLEEFTLAFRRRFGHTLRIPRANTSPDRTMKERIRSDAGVMERIRELCAADAEVYRRTFAGAGKGVAAC